MKLEKSDFRLGAVVLPARDGMLHELGYDIKELGPLALGIVIEEGSRRSQVHFPELRLSLWLETSEIKDVADEMPLREDFARLEKYFRADDAKKTAVFLMNRMILFLHATHVLGVDHGKLSDVWEESPGRLKEYYEGDNRVEVTRLSLGVEEFKAAEWEVFRQSLGSRLVLTRFLPSGMHKLELSIYFRRE